MLLYTDGLVERRDRDLDAGTAELVAVLQRVRRRSRWTSCATRCCERLFLPDAEDDVAMLAVRLHPQDEPRPAEAGPQVVPANIEPAPDVIPEARTERLSVRGCSAGAGAESVAGAQRAGRRRPAPPSRATPTAPAGRPPAR